MINQNDLHTDNSDNDNPTNKIRVVPSLGSKVTYEDSDRNEWKKAMILSRAGKSSGVNKYWFNIKDLKDGSVKSVDFENIKSWKNLDKQVLLCKNFYSEADNISLIGDHRKDYRRCLKN